MKRLRATSSTREEDEYGAKTLGMPFPFPERRPALPAARTRLPPLRTPRMGREEHALDPGPAPHLSRTRARGPGGEGPSPRRSTEGRAGREMVECEADREERGEPAQMCRDDREPPRSAEDGHEGPGDGDDSESRRGLPVQHAAGVPRFCRGSRSAPSRTGSTAEAIAGVVKTERRWTHGKGLAAQELIPALEVRETRPRAEPEGAPRQAQSEAMALPRPLPQD